MLFNFGVKMSTCANKEKVNLKGNGCLSKEPAKLSEEVFDYVVERIRTGNYKAGQKITERRIASDLGISHVPVRESMGRLQQLGWIDRFPNRGAYVKNFSVEHIEKLTQVREMLEAGAMSIVARTITQEQLRQVKELIDVFEQASKAKDATLYQETDAKFHRIFIGFLNNEILSNLFETIVVQSRGFFLAGALQAAFSWDENAEDLEFASHKHIYEALVSGKSDIAEKLIREHVRAGCQIAIMVHKTKAAMRKPV